MKKLVAANFLFFTLVSCSNAVQPTPAAVPTFDALLSIMPTETLPAMMTESGNILDPHGIPLQEWRGIPILPEAVAGQEFTEDNTYSFKANVTPKEVQDFYTKTLTELGWRQPFNNPFDANGGRMTFRREGNSISIIVTSSGDTVVVLLGMTLA